VAETAPDEERALSFRAPEKAIGHGVERHASVEHMLNLRVDRSHMHLGISLSEDRHDRLADCPELAPTIRRAGASVLPWRSFARGMTCETLEKVFGGVV
jgi:hypothetical protein